MTTMAVDVVVPCEAARSVTQALRAERIASIDEIRESWETLAAATGNIFASPEFIDTWWKHHGNGRLRIYACYDEAGRMRAILPVYAWRERPLRILRFLGHGIGDELGPIHLERDCWQVAAALRRLMTAERAAAIFAERLPASHGWSGMLKSSWSVRTGSPVLRLHYPSWDAYLSTRSSNFRQHLRRHERALVRDHRLTFRLATADSLSDDLEVLFDLHARRWRQPTNFLKHRLFHETFARVALERGWLRLWTLELDGRPAAAWYGFRYGGNESFFQSGRDPAWTQRPIGSILVAHSIREALEDGMTEYRFLRGDERYKYRFTDDDPGLETVILGNGPIGRIAASGAGALFMLRDAWHG